jgi:hypothetical protein
MENIDITTLVVHLVSGVIGAIIAGALFRGLSLGGLGNAVAGLIGGGVGGALLTTLFALPEASFAAGMEPMTNVYQAAAGAGSGLVVMIVLGILRSIFGGR